MRVSGRAIVERLERLDRVHRRIDVLDDAAGDDRLDGRRGLVGSGLLPVRLRGARRGGAATGTGGLPTGPVLERRAGREPGRQAERLLVGERPLGRPDLGVAAMPVIRDVGALVPVVDERDERAGGDAGVVGGALRHRLR